MSLNLSFGGKLNKDKVLQQLEKDIKSLSKNLGVELEKVSLKDVDKATSQIQKQINQLSKNINLNISKISLGNSGALQDIQKQINSALKGEKINLEVKSDLKSVSGDFEDILKKSKNLENEIQLLNGKMAKLSTVMDKKGNVKNTTLTYQYDEGRQAVEKYGWTVKEVEGELVRVFDLVDKKIVNNKSKLESANLSQEQFLTQLENRLNKIKTLSETQHLKNSNYNNIEHLESIQNVQNKINEAKAKSNRLTQEEKNLLSQELVKLDACIKKESSRSAEINRSTRFLTSQLRSLESLKIRVDNRGGGDKTKQSQLSSELERQINSYKKLIEENKILGSVERQRIQKTTNDMKVQTNELVRYQSQMSNILGRMKDYFIGTSIIGFSVGAIKEGFSTIQEVDTALTDFRKVTDLTKNEYSEFVDFANQKAKELSGSTADFIQSTANFIQMGYQNVNEAKRLAEDSQVYMNVGELTNEEATKSLITILKSFNLEASKSTEILDKTNQVANDFPITVKGLAGGMSRAGSVLKNASNDIDQSIALLTTANTSIQDPIRVSNGLKSIALNLEKVKMKAGKATPKLQDMMMTLTHGRVSLVQANGEFKSTYQIIKDLGAVWNDGTLKANEKALILQEVAGKHQANVLASLLSNAKDLDKIYEDSKNSAGSAEAENQRFMDSINGRLNALKENTKGIFLDLSNTDFLKNIISGANAGVSALRSLIEKIGAVNSMVGTLTFTLMSFNTNFRKKAIDKNLFGVGKIEELFIDKEYKMNDKIAAQRDFIKELKNTKTVQLGLNKATLSYTAELGKAKGSIIATKIELASLRVMATLTEAALTAGLSIAISAVVEGIVKLIDKLHMSKSELREFNQDIVNSFNSNIEDIKKSEGLVDKINNTKIQINNTSDTQKQNELKKQLLDYEKQLADVLPNAATEFDNEGNAIATNTKLIEENIRQKKQAAKDEVGDFIEKNKKFKEHVDEYIKDQKTLAENQLKLRQIQDSNKGKKWYERTENTTVLERDIKKAKEDIKDYSAEINNLIKMKKGLESAGVSRSDIGNIIGEDNLSALDQYNKYLQETQTSADGAKPSLEGLTNPLDAIKEGAIETADALDKLGSKFNKLTGNIGLVQKAMEEFKKTGTLSANTVGSILSSGDTRLISLLADKNNFMKNSIALEKTLRNESNLTYKQAIENSQNLLQQGIHDLSSKEAIEAAAANNSVGISNQETQAKANNYANDVNNHANSEEVKSTNTQNGSNARTGATADETNQKSGMYAKDSQNHGESEGTKVKNSANSANSMLDVNSQMVNGLADGYAKDATNFEKLTNDKIEMIDVFASKFDWVSAQVYKQTNSITTAVRTANFGVENSKALGLLPEDFSIPKQPSILEVGKTFGKANSHFDPIKVSTDPIRVDYSPEANGHSGGKGSGKKGKGSKGEKVDIKDIEDKIDKYKALQDAIDDVNNELEITKTLEENANGSDKLYYMNQELILYKEKKKAVNDLCWAKKQEAKALEEELIKNGFEAKNGDIANYTERLEAIKANVNAMDNSNKAKEKAIENYKKLKETADNYFNLTSKEIPQLQKEWYSLVKTIKEVSENQVKLMGDTEREMTNVIKDQVDKRRKEIEEATDKEKKAYEDKTKKLKEELQKQKDLYNENNDNEDFEQSLKEKQDKVNEINQKIDSVKRDTSGDGQSRLKELLKQKEEAEKDLNKFIRDRQKDQANKAFDKQMDELDKTSDKKNEELDKQKEDILKAFDDKYTSEKIGELAKGMIEKGFIEIEGHVIKLRDALDDYYKSQGEVFADSSLKMQKYIDNLELTKKLYLELTSINNNLGISSNNIIRNDGNNIVPVTTPKPVSFIAKSNSSPQIILKSNLNIGTVNKATLSDVENILEANNKKILEQLKDSLIIH
ncbi:phage tail tape measure protein [Clostridium perfringens]|uniref:Phage tail tape measure protein n=1 Tax=Clostridium perfringens TaxID=1502 RepID=A0AAP6WNX8_CLOPF|nr:phage tail tape measure protein [Clostridium perfringens]NGU31019.1 phage tail tape measure protein [Clostridium perfringens]